MVSIIVPVYNVQGYIIKCLESVAAQTYTGEIECLIIDDCGQDNSIRLAEEYIVSYKGHIDFRIIHHEHNRGLSAARNTGIREAKGEWIYFLDSDDWLDAECLNLMLQSTYEDQEVDFVVGKFKTTDDSNMLNIVDHTGIYGNPINLFCNCRIYVMAWNKLVKAALIKQRSLFFKEGLIHEDIPWSFWLSYYSKKVAIISQVTLHYSIRHGSIILTEELTDSYKWKAKALFVIIEELKRKEIILTRDIFCYLSFRFSVHFLDPILNNNTQMSKSFYQDFREISGAPTMSVFSLPIRKREKILYIHHFFPRLLGWYYCYYVYKLLF